MKIEASLPCSQEPAIFSYSQLGESISYHPVQFKIEFNVIIPSTLRYSKRCLSPELCKNFSSVTGVQRVVTTRWLL